AVPVAGLHHRKRRARSSPSLRTARAMLARFVNNGLRRGSRGDRKMTRLAFLAVLTLASCPLVAQPSGEGCAPVAGLEFVCGPQNPEDLVLVPGTDWIIASSMTEGAGLVLVDANEATWSELYPGARPRASHDPI